VKEELLVGPGEVAGEEFSEQPLVNVFLHRPAGPPAESAADQQPYPVTRLQLEHPEPIELDEVPQELAFREALRAHDFLERGAIQNQPGHEEQLAVGDDLLLLKSG
jgi:hypothetical protein